MKRILMITLLVMTMNLVGCSNKEITQAIESQKTEGKDFRNVNWGDDIETVKKLEDTKPTIERKNALAYRVTVAGYPDVFLAYDFDENGKLSGGAYSFEYNRNAGEDISRYKILKASLTEIYGEPKEDNISKTSDQANNQYMTEEELLKYGYVLYNTMWENENSRIVLLMKDIDYKIMTSVVYVDLKASPKERNKNGL